MRSGCPTIGEMVEFLKARRLVGGVDGWGHAVSGGGPAADAMPWFVQVPATLGAWAAAAFLVAALGAMGLLTRNPSGHLMTGLLFIGSATLLRPREGVHFFRQLCLALSVAGHLLVFASFAMSSFSFVGPALSSLLLAVVLYRAYPDRLHRFLSVETAILLNICAVVEQRWVAGLPVVVLAEILGLGLVFARGRLARDLRPLAYALAAALPVTLALMTLDTVGRTTPEWPTRLLMAGALLWLIDWAIGGTDPLGGEPVWFARAAVLALAVVTTSGILASIGLMVLGRGRQDRVLSALGMAGLVVFLVLYYYDLKATLAVKSAVLIGSGLVLLGSRAVLATRPWAGKEVAA